jgi:hypothetical protein
VKRQKPQQTTLSPFLSPVFLNYFRLFPGDLFLLKVEFHTNKAHKEQAPALMEFQETRKNIQSLLRIYEIHIMLPNNKDTLSMLNDIVLISWCCRRRRQEWH